jgi:hypothetical protein
MTMVAVPAGSCEERDLARSSERFAGLFSLCASMWRVSRALEVVQVLSHD